MKVSIPDPVFAETELLAKRLRTTGSDTRALAAFITTHARNRVTDKMNYVVDTIDPVLNMFVQAASRRMLNHVEW